MQRRHSATLNIRMNKPLLLSLCLAAAAVSHAQGTRLWTQSSYSDLQKGTTTGVAIRSDGRIQPAPATSLVSTLASTYAWSLASDASGNALVGTGSTSGTPSALLKIARDGKTIKLAEFKEMAVQALLTAPDGSIYAATSPDGKVYRLPANAPEAKPGTVQNAVFDASQTSEKPKYIWALAFDPSTKSLYIATGAPAAIYKVNTAQASAKPTLFFKSQDQHIRSLVLAPDGTLYAGSDGSGVIYRISREGKPFAVYSAPKREITALALDSSGNLYAAAVGGKSTPPLPPLPVQGNAAATATITILTPASASAASANTLVPEGSDIDRISPDGTPQKLLTLSSDVVYALAVRNGKLLAATGNKGHIYSIDTAEAGRFTLLARLDASQAMAFAPVKTGLLIATSNTGKLWLLADDTAKNPTYTSQIFDAHTFSQWGRMEVRADNPSAIDFYARSGNVENPTGAWSDWARVNPGVGWADGAPLDLPAGRFVQWKAEFKSDRPKGAAAPFSTPAINSVALNYLPKNVAPAVEEVVVQLGARVPQTPQQNGRPTVAISFSRPSQSNFFSFPQPDEDTAPLSALKDRTSITARWLAHDDNGDKLRFSLYYRGDGEQNWQLLKDRITSTFYSFNSELLPDGGYTFKVVASDAPSHSPGAALTGEHTSSHVEVDTTPPVLSALNATLQQASIHATLDARDATSPISRAEYSVDAGPWHYLEPTGKMSDSLTEHYDFTAPVPPLSPDAEKPENPKEHVIAVHVYDRYDNMAAVKAIVR